MNHFESPCASEGIPLRVPVYTSGETDALIGQVTPPVEGASAESEIISAVNLLKTHGWTWEPTDPGRWGLFPVTKWPLSRRANG